MTLDRVEKYRVEPQSLGLDDLLRMEKLVQTALANYRAKDLPSEDSNKEP